jgi:hypothetical protein
MRLMIYRKQYYEAIYWAHELNWTAPRGHFNIPTPYTTRMWKTFITIAIEDVGLGNIEALRTVIDARTAFYQTTDVTIRDLLAAKAAGYLAASPKSCVCYWLRHFAVLPPELEELQKSYASMARDNGTCIQRDEKVKEYRKHFVLNLDYARMKDKLDASDLEVLVLSLTYLHALDGSRSWLPSYIKEQCRSFSSASTLNTIIAMCNDPQLKKDCIALWTFALVVFLSADGKITNICEPKLYDIRLKTDEEIIQHMTDHLQTTTVLEVPDDAKNIFTVAGRHAKRGLKHYNDMYITDMSSDYAALEQVLKTLAIQRLGNNYN